jgi:signal transduction histidine kinase
MSAWNSIREDLEEYYAEHGGWSDVADHVMNLEARHPGQMLIVLDSADRLIAPQTRDLDISRDVDGGYRIVRSSPKGSSLVSEIHLRSTAGALEDSVGHPIGRAFVLPAPDPAYQPPRDRFLGSMNRWIAVLLVAGGGLGILAAGILANRIIRPLRELRNAANEIATGDLSRRARVEGPDELVDLAISFNAMADALARFETLRRDMIADIAHELRTPLTAVRCQIEAAQDGLLAITPGLISSMHEEILGLGRLVEDLQTLSLADAGELHLDPALVDLVMEVEKAAAAIRKIRGDDPPPIRILAPPDPFLVRLDAIRFQQIMRNLLDNAARHTPKTGQIIVSVHQGVDAAEVEVIDSGTGIAEDDLPLVFDRFYRTDASKRHGVRGAGLGLAIVRRLVEAHGWKITVASTPGKGAAFRIRLPAKEGDA